MLNTSNLLIDACTMSLVQGYQQHYPAVAEDYAGIIASSAQAALGKIACTNALYHNLEHTIYVTTAGQAILTGMILDGQALSASLWTHAIIALLCHDIGIVRGICQADTDISFSTGLDLPLVTLKIGASDAAMLPYHLDRGKQYIAEQYDRHPLIEVAQVQAYIERTRFPVPKAASYQMDDDLAGLVRAADLIGQLSDPRYLHKLNALFYEFEETGTNAALNYLTPDDVLLGYPRFYQTMVAPYIQKGLYYLDKTPAGQTFVRYLQHNLQVAQQAITKRAGGG